jgi:hypothetical protein
MVRNELFLVVLSRADVLSKAQTSADMDGAQDPPIFSCVRGRSHLHTHLPADQVLYHMGKGALATAGFSMLTLTDDSEKHWFSLTSLKVREVVEKLPKIKIPGGKMSSST